MSGGWRLAAAAGGGGGSRSAYVSVSGDFESDARQELKCQECCWTGSLFLLLSRVDSRAFEDGSDGEKADCSHATRERARLLCGYGNCEQSMGDDTALIQIS